jgi:hypothetical protein
VQAVKRAKHAAASARKLVVQVDNAASENKNRWVFGLLALFVLWGWFDEVQANCLLQGHTHDAQDAIFGVLKSAMAREGTFAMKLLISAHVPYSDYLFTLGDFAAFLDKVFPTVDTRPSVAVMDNAIDWKAYLDPHLTKISGHTGMEDLANTGGPRAFRFRMCKDVQGSPFVGMQNKDYAGDPSLPWIGVKRSVLDADAVPVFASIPDAFASAPLCAAETQLPATLVSDTLLLREWFNKGERLVSHPARTWSEDAIAWFQSIHKTATLGVRPAAHSPGVGQAGTLHSAVFSRDVAVRLVCAAPSAIPISSFRDELPAAFGGAAVRKPAANVTSASEAKLPALTPAALGAGLLATFLTTPRFVHGQVLLALLVSQRRHLWARNHSSKLRSKSTHGSHRAL